MGYLKSTGTVFIYVSFVLALITFLPGLPPANVSFSEYSIALPTKLTGKLASNDRLNEAELLHVGKIKGPESFDSYNGELYTGIHGGYIVKIDEKGFKPFVKFGEECDGIWQEHKCGRPLGLKFDKKGNLYAIDTYYGIFKIDPSGKYKKIIDTSKPIAGKVPLLVNSLDVTENGDIYWTVSSTDFSLYDGIYTALADPSGRLIRYNAATKTNEVLLEGLVFPNGVLLSRDESFILVLETYASRIIKYNLKGAKKGQKEIFSESLPGLPDNIHSDNHGGFLVSLIVYADEEYPMLLQSLIPHPYIRKMLVRLLALIEAPFKLLQGVQPNFYTEKLIHTIGSFESSRLFVPSTSVVLHYDATGKIVDAAYVTNEKIDSISSAFIHKDYLWFGSPYTDYVARIPLSKAFPLLAQTEKLMRDSNVYNTKEHLKKHSSTERSQTVKTTIDVPTSTTTKPTTTAAGSTGTSASAKTVHKTSTTQKQVVSPTPTTTTKPSTVPKTTTNLKEPEATIAPPKPSAETVPKSNTKEIKDKNVDPVKLQKNTHTDPVKPNLKTEEKKSTSTINDKVENTQKTLNKNSHINTSKKTLKTEEKKSTTSNSKTENAKQTSEKTPDTDSSKQDLKTEKNKVSNTASNVKTENTQKITSKSETNKQKVQNVQYNTPKPVKQQEHQSSESTQK